MTPRALATWVAVLVGVGGAVGCGDNNQTEVTVYAASSLAEAFEDLADQYEAANPETKIRLSFAGSARLAAQIEAGAAADVFASADLANMDRVVAAGRTTQPPQVFARNHLTLVTPANNPGQIHELADLADGSLVVAICAPEVPCGALTQTVLNNAGISVDADTEETNVRAVLTKVILGEADAGLVYATDVAAGGDRIKEVAIYTPENSPPPTTDYPVVNLSNQTEATAFTAFLTGTEGRRILADHGFELP